MKALSNKIIKFLIKFLVSLAFAAWLVFKVKWLEVLAFAKMLSPWEVFLYLVVVIFGMLISSKKWQMMLEKKNIDFSIKELFIFYLTGTFINNFMPSTIGGDTYRAYSAGKKNGKYLDSASSVVMDRVTGLLGLMILTLFFALLNWQEVTSHSILLLLNVGTFILLAAIFFMEKGRKKVFKFIPLKVKEFMKTLHEYYLHRKLFGSAIAFSMLFALVGVALANYILFFSLGIKIGVLNYLSVIFLISIISAFPVSINNIGIKEWAYVTFFGFFGISASAVVAVALISRFLQMLLSFLALPFYLKDGKALRD